MKIQVWKVVVGGCGGTGMVHVCNHLSWSSGMELPGFVVRWAKVRINSSVLLSSLLSTRPEYICYQCLNKLKKSKWPIGCASKSKHLPDPCMGQGLPQAHHTAQHGTAAWTPTFPGSPPIQEGQGGSMETSCFPAALTEPIRRRQTTSACTWVRHADGQDEQGDKYLGSHLARQ